MWRRSGIFIVNFEYISHLVLVFLLLTLRRQMPTGKYIRPSFKVCWMWIVLWIKLSWHSCSMWDKLGWLDWFWQFLCERLSFFHQKGFYYSYAWPCSLCEGRTSFCTGLTPRKTCGLLLTFLIGFTYSVSSFFFLYQSPSSSLCMVFDVISSHRWGSLDQSIC